MKPLGDSGWFRSPLLHELPPEIAGRTPRQLRRRRVGMALAMGFGVCLYLWAWLRWRPEDSLSRIVFWLWDFVYLPLKGYFYTWLRPGSWIYLLTAAVLAGAAVAGYLAKRPLTPAKHVRLARRLLSRPRGRRRLERWCRWRKRIVHKRMSKKRRREDAGPDREGQAVPRRTLLEEVIDHERTMALDVDSELGKAVDLTLISARVLLEPPTTDDERLLAVSHLDQALMRLELLGAGALRARVEEELARALTPFLSYPGPPDFSPPVLAAELGLLLGLVDAANDEERRRRIVDGVTARRRLLDDGRRRLEQRWAFGRRSRSFVEIRAPGSEIAARLALDLALLTALRQGEPQIALAYLESLEGLRFMLLATVAEMPAARTSLGAIGRLPEPFDYRVCAELTDRRLAAATDLAEARRRGSEVLPAADLDLAVARNSELFIAADDRRRARAPEVRR